MAVREDATRTFSVFVLPDPIVVGCSVPAVRKDETPTYLPFTLSVNAQGGQLAARGPQSDRSNHASGH